MIYFGATTEPAKISADCKKIKMFNTITPLLKLAYITLFCETFFRCHIHRALMKKDWLLYCYFNRLYYEIIIITTTQKQSKWITCNVDTKEKHWYNMPLQKKYHWSSLIIPPYYLACARFVVEGKQQVSSLLRFCLSDCKLNETFKIQAPNYNQILPVNSLQYWSGGWVQLGGRWNAYILALLHMIRFR